MSEKSRNVITSKDLAVILRECADYVESTENTDDYLMEFAKTGLFHDAIGKVIQTTFGKIVITTDY